MKIAVDARMLEMSGIGTYLQHLFEGDLYSIALGDKTTIHKYASDVKTISFKSNIYGIKEQLRFPYKELKKEKIDILHIPHYNVPVFYRGKLVVTIHDLTHLVLPEFLPNKFAYIYAKFMTWFAAHRAALILTVSENTKSDIVRLLHVNKNKVISIPLAIDSSFREKQNSEIGYLYKKFNLPTDKNIILYVGNIKPHKNAERLLKAYAASKCLNSTVLVLVGKAFESVDLPAIIKKLSLSENIICTGAVTKDELIDLYNSSSLFVFPSLYEGFGLPPLEAMACGTPVLCANNSSLPEVVGNAAELFDAYDLIELRSKIDSLINDAEKRKKLIALGFDRIRLFSWDKCIRTTKNEIELIFKINS